MNISSKYDRLLARRAPSEDRFMEKFAESYEAQPGKATSYILGAMKAVEAKYTNRLIEQGNRVQNQLEKRLGDDYPSLEFRRQGSVSNNTHIKFYSDVDVLVIIDKFYSLQPPLVPQIPYQGNPIDDLTVLRSDCVRELQNAFPKVDVNNDNSMAICLSNGSLACDVDVVPSNWYDTITYSNSSYEHDRGIQVFNKNTKTRVMNFPFLNNYRIDQHDRTRQSVPRMLMRLLKTTRADVEAENPSVGCSSYDLCSLVYRMPDDHYFMAWNRPLAIVGSLLNWLRTTLDSPERQGSLQVVDDSRLIYRDDAVRSGVELVYAELQSTYTAALLEVRDVNLILEAHVA